MIKKKKTSFIFTLGFQFWEQTDVLNINMGIYGSFNATTE